VQSCDDLMQEKICILIAKALESLMALEKLQYVHRDVFCQVYSQSSPQGNVPYCHRDRMDTSF